MVDRKLVTRPRDRLVVQPSNGTMQSYASSIGVTNLHPLAQSVSLQCMGRSQRAEIDLGAAGLGFLRR